MAYCLLHTLLKIFLTSSLDIFHHILHTPTHWRGYNSINIPVFLWDKFLKHLGPAILIRQRRRWHPIPVLLPGKSHGRRSPVGCSPWGRSESDRTERLHFHFSPSCIGEGNGNPLQYSCLENPRDRGAWWAAVYGVAKSRTRLTRLSSSSSILIRKME